MYDWETFITFQVYFKKKCSHFCWWFSSSILLCIHSYRVKEERWGNTPHSKHLPLSPIWLFTVQLHAAYHKPNIFKSFLTVFRNIIFHNILFSSKNNNENVLCLSCFSTIGYTYPILSRLLLEDLNICFQSHSSAYVKLTKCLLCTRSRRVCWTVNKIGKNLCFHRNYILIQK